MTDAKSALSYPRLGQRGEVRAQGEPSEERELLGGAPFSGGAPSAHRVEDAEVEPAAQRGKGRDARQAYRYSQGAVPEERGASRSAMAQRASRMASDASEGRSCCSRSFSIRPTCSLDASTPSVL